MKQTNNWINKFNDALQQMQKHNLGAQEQEQKIETINRINTDLVLNKNRWLKQQNNRLENENKYLRSCNQAMHSWMNHQWFNV